MVHVCAAGITGGFAGGERGVQQFVEKGELELVPPGKGGLLRQPCNRPLLHHNGCCRAPPKPSVRLMGISSHAPLQRRRSPVCCTLHWHSGGQE